ncbi:DUF4097 family beta strand repeat-containing protein [Brachybacterium alimentarium]|uniref:DUF4097 family beta strand repeat-containing protein n=1 Tax=Brachybacterium alimentarium TaxID=47845 RepID=UPI003FD03B8C
MTIPQQPASSTDQSSDQHSAGTAAPLVHEFTASGPVDVNVQNLRGAITLRAEHGTAVRVELDPHGAAAQQILERLTVRFEHDHLVVDIRSDEFGRVGADLSGFFRSFGSGDRSPFSDRLAEGVRSLVRSAEGLAGELGITVVVPSGSRAVLSDGAGDVRVLGALARLEARTGAGEVHLERGAAESTRLSTGTGHLTVGPSAGDLSAKTGAGDVLLEQADGHVSITTGAGDVTVRRARSGHLTARTGLGDMTFHVSPGTATRLDLATGLGDRDVQLDPADGAGQAERTLEIEAKSGKGDLRVLRAEH